MVRVVAAARSCQVAGWPLLNRLAQRNGGNVSDISSLWQSQFPTLASSRDPVVGETLEQARFVRLEPDTVVFEPGSPCSDYLMLVAGLMRVEITNEQGRQIVLYRVQPGQGCFLTTSCLLSHDRYPATGIVEADASALMLSRQAFEKALAGSSDFRGFIFAGLGGRLAQLVERIESVALTPIEQRLARTLLDLADNGNEVRWTHQELAAELGSAREVISRGLTRFVARGWVHAARGRIRLLDTEALADCGGR